MTWKETVPLEVFPQPRDRTEHLKQETKHVIYTVLGDHFEYLFSRRLARNYNLPDILKIITIYYVYLAVRHTCVNRKEVFLYGVTKGHIHNESYWKPYNMVNLKPCDTQDTDKHLHHTIKGWSIATLCIPPHGKILSDHNRFETTVMIVEDSKFHLNMSFIHFSFTSHIWCYGDFVDIVHPFRWDKPGYVFCGKKHPWSIIGLSNIVRVKAIAKGNSNFTLLYQIMDKHLTGFHLCQLDNCQKSQCDLLNHGQYRAKEGDVIFFTHILEYDMEIYVIFLLTVIKYNYLELTGDLQILDLFDGPTIESRQIASFHNRVKFSAFQATLVAKTRQLGNINLRAISYTVIPNVGENRTVTSPNMFSFHKDCFDKNCVVFDTVWLKQLPQESLNVTVMSMESSGPREPRLTTDQYGGIGIHFIENNGKTVEALTVSYNLSMSSDYDELFNSEKYHTVIGGPETEYVVIVYFYFAKYGTARAEVLLATTSCTGYVTPLKPCTETLRLCFRKENCPHSQNLALHSKTKCVVLVMKNTLSTNLEFYYDFNKETFSPSQAMARTQLCLAKKCHQK